MWNRLSAIDKWPAGKASSHIVQGSDHWLRHVTPFARAVFQNTDWYLLKPFNKKLILDPFLHAAWNHWVPAPACSGGLWLLRESTTWFTPTPQFSRPDPFFHTPAHVSFIPHVLGCQGLSERPFYFSIQTMNQHIFSLYNALIYMLLVFWGKLFFVTETGEQRKEINHGLLGKETPLCFLFSWLVVFNYDKLNWMNTTSNELCSSKHNSSTCPNVTGFWTAFEDEQQDELFFFSKVNLCVLCCVHCWVGGF